MLAQPQMTFAGQDLYPSLAEKAAALGFSLVCNHPFVDGNKRVGAMAAFTFLKLNGLTLTAKDTQFESIILTVAQSKMGKAGVAGDEPADDYNVISVIFPGGAQPLEADPRLQRRCGALRPESDTCERIRRQHGERRRELGDFGAERDER